MNIVVHMTECKPNSTIASARVAKFICETLPGFKLVDTEHEAAVHAAGSVDLENLIIVNGPMAFCPFLADLAVLVSHAKNVIWVQQDYTIMPPSADSKAQSPFRKVFADRQLRPYFWTTVKKNVKASGDKYINWNQLTYDPQPYPELSRHPILMYYGAYREKRESDFRFYFAGAPYPVHVSTTPIRGKKFKQLSEHIQIVPPFTSLGSMPVCSASIYIEDAKSHDEFHSPANRFYELLSAGIPIMFDVRTTKMLGQAGIFPNEEWIVRSQQDVLKFISQPVSKLDLIRKEQRYRWNLNYKLLLETTLLNIWKEHNGTNT